MSYGGVPRYGVGIKSRSSVPTVWNTLITWLILESSTVARDGEERLERLLVQVAIRVLRRMIRHHCSRKSISSWRNQDACKLWEEEVRIAGNRIVETRLAKGQEGLILLGSRLNRMLAGRLQLVAISKLPDYLEVHRSIVETVGLGEDNHYPCQRCQL